MATIGDGLWQIINCQWSWDVTTVYEVRKKNCCECTRIYGVRWLIWPSTNGMYWTIQNIWYGSVKPFFIRICGPPKNYYQLVSWHIGVPTFMLHLFSWATHLWFEMWTTSQDTHPPSHTITKSQWRTHLRTFVFWPPPMFGPTKTKLRREPHGAPSCCQHTPPL